MSATAFEQVLARVAVVLSAAGVGTVERRRADLWSQAELPAVEIRRGDVSSAAFGDVADRASFVFRLSYLCRSGGLSETALDGMHQQAYAALQADAVLLSLGRGLRCSDVGEPQEEACGEGICARMDAAFVIQLITRRADLATVR